MQHVCTATPTSSSEALITSGIRRAEMDHASSCEASRSLSGHGQLCFQQLQMQLPAVQVASAEASKGFDHMQKFGLANARLEVRDFLLQSLLHSSPVPSSEVLRDWWQYASRSGGTADREPPEQSSPSSAGLQRISTSRRLRPVCARQ